MTIEAAKSKLINSIYISSESDKIIKMPKIKSKLRDQKNYQKVTYKIEALKHCVRLLEEIKKNLLFCFLQLTHYCLSNIDKALII